MAYTDRDGTDPKAQTEADTITVYHRTSLRQAKGMATKGVTDIASKGHAWLGEGLYAVGSPDSIPDAKGEACAALKIRTDNIVDVTKELGPVYEWNEKGSQLRGAISYSGATKDSDYTYTREGSHVQKMKEVLRKYAGKTLAIKKPDGTTHYIIRDSRSVVGKPTVAGTYTKEGTFVPRAAVDDHIDHASKGVRDMPRDLPNPPTELQGEPRIDYYGDDDLMRAAEFFSHVAKLDIVGMGRDIIDCISSERCRAGFMAVPACGFVNPPQAGGLGAKVRYPGNNLPIGTGMIGD